MDFSSFATLSLLCLFPVIISVLSLECDPTQYPWPTRDPKFCCDMCKPGQHMESRNPNDFTKCTTHCEECRGSRYTDSYNIGECKVCKNCHEATMEKVTSCNRTHNTVCRCKAGFRWANEQHDRCTEVTTPTATTKATSRTVSGREVLSTPRPSTTTTTTTTTATITSKPVQDTVWFLVIISLLCLGIALVIVTKMKTMLNWFTHNKCHYMVEKPRSTSVSLELTTEDKEEEEASTPVQEMCGKCEQPIDV